MTPRAKEMKKDDCVFCRKIREGSVVDAGDGVFRFEPLNPVVEGHMLFIPEAHVIDAKEDPHITGVVTRVASQYASAIGDCNIIINVGKDAGQTVFHLHVHVVPRQENDGLKLPWTDQIKKSKQQ